MPIRKLLIANRAEIAIRVAKTCRTLGISPVAVFSDADRDAPHTRAADESVAIGPSYLNIDRIIDAAKKINADAIHPGYGFLAENADFAEACERAGISFIGPSSKAIRLMGLKTGSRDIAASAGVPILPDYHASSRSIDYPVIIKAAAGGGGRGMRIVPNSAELPEALDEVIAKGLAKDPALRYRSSGELAGACVAAVGLEPLSQPPDAPELPHGSTPPSSGDGAGGAARPGARTIISE